MNPFETIKKYLRDRMGLLPEQTGYPFVTISREAGAGGHTLAREIIRRLPEVTTEKWGRGWELFDYRLCLLVAQDQDLKAPLETLLRDEYPHGFQQTIHDMLTGQAEQYCVQKRIFQVVRILAAMGRVVIVGRASNYMTRGLPQGLHVRLVAPEALRVQQMRELLDVSDEEARRTMLKQDQERVDLVRDFFNRDVNNPLDYDCVWNTGRVAIAQVADIVVRLIAARTRPAERQRPTPLATRER